MYLFEYNNKTSKTYEVIHDILSKRLVEGKIHNHSRISINSCMSLYFEGVDTILSEFPGNCSALILNSIQGVVEGRECCEDCASKADNLIETAIEISQALEYALLLVSGTSQIMRDYFITKYGFKVLMSDIKNPHSNNLNYFLVKEF